MKTHDDIAPFASLLCHELKTVWPDAIPGLGTMPGCEGMVCPYGNMFPAWTNSYGAVAAIFPDGRMLGVKPDEFEVVEFFPLP